MITSNQSLAAEQTALVGSLASLACDVNSDSPAYLLEWYKNGKIIYTKFNGRATGDAVGDYSDRLREGQNHTLIIQPTDEHDSGDYYCRLKLFNRSSQHPTGHKIRLNVHTPPRLLSAPKAVVYAARGQSLSLTCEAKGLPKPEIKWKQDKQDISELSGHLRLVSDNSTLVLDRLDKDGQSFTCTALNTLGQTQATTVVRFAEPARFERELSNVTVVEGNEFPLQCEARGQPPHIVYEWYKDEVEVRMAGELGLRADVKEGMLFIKPVRRSDAGWYTCTADNGHGEQAKSRAYLNVQYAAEISPDTQPIQYLPLGLDGKVECLVNANPPVDTVIWHKDNQQVSNSQTRFEKQNDGTILVVKEVKATDGGVYKCQAYNQGAGSNRGRSEFEIHVIVDKPPKMTKAPPSLVTRSAGQSLYLQCGGEGKPEPEVFWRRILPSVQYPYGTVTGLTAVIDVPVTGASDYGVFECVVRNRVTELVTNTTVLINGTPPQSPIDFSVDTSAFDARLSWKGSYDGGAAQQYKIRYRIRGPDNRWEDVIVNGNQKHVLSRLQPDTDYEFLISPFNQYGKGFDSQLITVRTKDHESLSTVGLPLDANGQAYYPDVGQRRIGPGPNAPQNLLVTTANHEIKLCWEESLPAAGLPAVVYYSVEYKQLGEHERNPMGRFNILAKPVHEPSLTIVAGTLPRPKSGKTKSSSSNPIRQRGNLLAGETYLLQVRAHSLVSHSDPSNRVQYRVSGVSPQVAVMAAILGGLLFLVLFMILALCLVRRAKQRGKAQRIRRKEHQFSNGNQYHHHNGNGHGGGWLQQPGDESFDNSYGYAKIHDRSGCPASTAARSDSQPAQFCPGESSLTSINPSVPDCSSHPSLTNHHLPLPYSNSNPTNQHGASPLLACLNESCLPLANRHNVSLEVYGNDNSHSSAGFSQLLESTRLTDVDVSAAGHHSAAGRPTLTKAVAEAEHRLLMETPILRESNLSEVELSSLSGLLAKFNTSSTAQTDSNFATPVKGAFSTMASGDYASLHYEPIGQAGYRFKLNPKSSGRHPPLLSSPRTILSSSHHEPNNNFQSDYDRNKLMDTICALRQQAAVNNQSAQSSSNVIQYASIMHAQSVNSNKTNPSAAPHATVEECGSSTSSGVSSDHNRVHPPEYAMIIKGKVAGPMTKTAEQHSPNTTDDSGVTMNKLQHNIHNDSILSKDESKRMDELKEEYHRRHREARESELL